MPTSPSTPTARENGRTMLLAVLVLIVLVTVILPTSDTRFALMIGVLLGATGMYAMWMHESAGRDTSREDKAP